MARKKVNSLPADHSFELAVLYKVKNKTPVRLETHMVFRFTQNEAGQIYHQDDRNVLLKKVLELHGLGKDYEVRVEVAAGDEEDEGSEDEDVPGEDEQPTTKYRWLPFGYCQLKQDTTPQASSLKTVRTLNQYFSFRNDIADYISTAGKAIKGGIFILLDADLMTEFKIKRASKKRNGGGIGLGDVTGHGKASSSITYLRIAISCPSQRFKENHDWDDTTSAVIAKHEELEKQHSQGVTDADGNPVRMTWRCWRLWALAVTQGEATMDTPPSNLPYESAPDARGTRRGGARAGSSSSGLSISPDTAAAFGKGIGDAIGLALGGRRGAEQQHGEPDDEDGSDDEDGLMRFIDYLEVYVPDADKRIWEHMKQEYLGPFSLKQLSYSDLKKDFEDAGYEIVGQDVSKILKYAKRARKLQRED